MWLKTRSGYYVNSAHVVKFDRTIDSGTYYISAQLINSTAVDLAGAYSSESDLLEALAKLTMGFDATILVP